MFLKQHLSQKTPICFFLLTLVKTCTQQTFHRWLLFDTLRKQHSRPFGKSSSGEPSRRLQMFDAMECLPWWNTCQNIWGESKDLETGQKIALRTEKLASIVWNLLKGKSSKKVGSQCVSIIPLRTRYLVTWTVSSDFSKVTYAKVFSSREITAEKAQLLALMINEVINLTDMD